MGQNKKVTVEYLYADGTLDSYIAELLEAKMALIAAVEAEDVPDGSILKEIEAKLRSLAPALMEEARLASKSPDAEGRINQITDLYPKIKQHESPIEEVGAWEFPSSSDPEKRYQVTYGRTGHLECSCPGFNYRGECKHVREIRKETLE